MNDDNESPFRDQSRERRHVLRWSLYLGIPLAAVAAAYFSTRTARQPTAGAAHDHAAAPAAETGKPVMLSSAEAKRIGVTYAVASMGELKREIRTVGQVTFDERRVKAISLKVDGWVERLFVDFTGQAVQADAPLFGIYSPMLVTAQEELLLARRLQSQVASGSEDARTSAADLLSSSRRRLAYWDIAPGDIARIESTGHVERTLTFRSPVSGFVVEKNILQGQRVMAGDALYKIADLGIVWVEGNVFEQDLASVRLGQAVTAELEAVPGEAFHGRITYVYPTLDPDTRTARVRVELPNRDLRLKPGMYATLRLTGTGRAGTVSVPRTAVLSTGERNLVFVKRPDGMLEPRLVALGMASDDRIEIRRGLAAGDTVAASATFLIDAESNLGTALGGMGDMPGMDMTAPTKAPKER
ncbi:MAG TPA: efflux RND transporter periplasmic adaptor subunit [Gemmatimonadaceae bacterium]|nr:efflux RND transporter periplasmic adaptor subunit [Gemmatimonadaceae bacterium]